MILLIPNGGLGNQMFQYAAAKALSLRLHTKFMIDLSFFELHRNKAWNRDYELDIFDLKAPVRNKNFKGVAMCRLKEFFIKFNLNKEYLFRFGLFMDIYNANVYNIRFEHLKNGTTLFGYFQNEKYFKNHIKEIRHDFTFLIPLNEQNQFVAEKISSCHSVSLHIRRGDYLSDNKAANHFTNLPPDYYRAAINYIQQHVENPYFFVFTDDMDWVKAQYNESNIIFVDINKGKDSYNDMRLMSLCKHNIIANSSFSWWGAYLNKHPEKIVIAPKSWYKNKERNAIAISNLLPNEWIKI